MPKSAVRIALDVMGGVYAHTDVVKGAVLAARKGGIELILVGPLDTIEAELTKYDTSGLAIRRVRADEFVREGEHPALALRRKPNATVVVATNLVKSGEADAIVSAGNTGAVVASALYLLGAIEGLDRPVVGGPILGLAPNTVLMDGGGNIDCKPYHLLNFAIVGCVYARKMLNIPNPTVAVLSVGAEKGKGNALAKETYDLFEKSGLNFIGNVEGHDIVGGKANVIVCDGFVGNILIKFCEGLGVAISDWLQTQLKGRLPQSDINSLSARLHTLTSPADTLGGGPLWGVKGVSCVSHGRSKAPQIAGTIEQAKKAVESGLVEALNSELLKFREKIKQ